MVKRLAAAFLLFAWIGLAAAEPPRLLVLPFEFSAQRSFEHLERALPDLLASRIGQGKEVIIVQAGAPPELSAGRRAFSGALARELGAAHRADYVLYGRVTEIGDRFSVDAALYDARSGDAVGRYSVEGADLSQFIPKVGELGQSLRQRFAAAAQAAAPPAAARKTWFSPPLAIEMRGVGAGEVTQSGTSDIVLITREEVQVYRRQADRLELVTRYAAAGGLENIGVDVASLDGDGRAKIYVTATAPGNSLASYVLQWNGAALQPVASRLPWHLRITQLTDGPALLAQQRGLDAFFEGPVRRLAWREGKLVAGEALELPGHVTLYSFVVADLDDDGRPEVISLQSRSALTVYDAQGRVLRRGAQYGQSAVYVVEKRERNDAPAEEAQLPGRLRAIKLPGRRVSLLAAQNHEAIGFFHRARDFTNGEIVALRWQADGLEEVWRTERLAYVADFQVSTLKPGDAPVLVIGTVTTFRGAFSPPRSFIVLAPLEQ